MLLKRHKVGAFIRVRVHNNWCHLKTNLRRYKDPDDGDVNYCSQYCIFWNTAEEYCKCKYNTEIDCEDFDTDNYSYVPC